MVHFKKWGQNPWHDTHCLTRLTHQQLYSVSNEDGAGGKGIGEKSISLRGRGQNSVQV